MASDNNHGVGSYNSKEGTGSSRKKVKSSKDLKLEKLGSSLTLSEYDDEDSGSNRKKEISLNELMDREFKKTETAIKAKRKSMKERMRGNTVDQDAMDHLKINFDKYDAESHR